MNAAADQTELHNELAGQIVSSIVRPPIEAGGKMSDVLVLTESIILGVMMIALEYGYPPEDALDVLVSGVKKRLAQERRKLT